jgi:nicotinamide-nucleotide amidase
MLELSKDFGEFCVENGLVVTTAESCTAGLLAATIAQTPGSSAWLESGFVVYTAEAKNKMLGLNPETIKEFNITSMEVSSEMAWGASERSSANVIMAVTGVAGPAGGTTEIPVGTVCMSWIFKLADTTETHDEIVVFKGERNEIRDEVVEYMLRQCIAYYEEIDG